MNVCVRFSGERKQEGLSYDDEVLFPDLVEDHLADVVFVERGRQWDIRPLIISAHHQVGFICRKAKMDRGLGTTPNYQYRRVIVRVLNHEYHHELKPKWFVVYWPHFAQ